MEKFKLNQDVKSNFKAELKSEVKSSTAKDFNYELWKQLQDELHPDKTGRFLATSIFIHGLFIVIAFAASLQMFEDKKNETVEIEFINSGSVAPKAQASSTPSQATSAPMQAPVSEPVVAAAPIKSEKDEVVMPAKAALPPPMAAAPKTLVPTTKTVKQMPQAISAPAQVRSSAPKSVAAKIQTFQTESPVALPDNVNDIQEPQLSESAAAAINPNEINDDEDLKKDFAKVDHHQKKQVLALAKDLEDQNKEALSETEKVADQLAQQNEMEGEKIAAFNATQRARDAQAIAAAESSERAAAAKAQQEAKEARAAQAAQASAAAAAAASAAQAAAQEKAQKESAGNGLGSEGAAKGSPTGIRDAQDLRQRPGNPIPQYEQNERLLGHQGKVVFLAYITPEGVPTQFKLSESTGFKNLDGKTLKSLKQWRFYPGQEGWVEMAFNWNLKGGAQEMPALLKRSAK